MNQRLFININPLFIFKSLCHKFIFWGIIKYYQEKAFLGVISDLIWEQDNTLIGGYIKDSYYYFLDDLVDEYLVYVNIGGNLYKLLGYYNINIDLNKFEEYKRTKRSIMDVLANISALSMTILNIIVFVFSYFYSSNFDNYKIVEKLLLKERILIQSKKNKNKDISEDTNDDKIKLIELIDNSGKDEALLEINTEKKNKIIEDEKNNEGNNVNKNEERAIPKLTFIFYL